MNIFLDTNIILDWLLNREGAEATMKVFSYAHGPFTKCSTSILSIANIAYICRKEYSNNGIKTILKDVFDRCKILPMGDQMFYNALKCKSPDFEDSLQIQCAEFECCDVIITRNVSHYKAYTPLPVFTPEEFLALADK